MIPRIGQICLKFRLPRFTSRRPMSDGKGKGGQTMKFDIGTGDKKKSYEFIDEKAGQERANSFYNWFRTVKGQKTVGGFWIGLSVLGALYQVAPHWFFLNQVKSIYQSYTKGFKTPVRNELLKLLNEVVNEMNLSDEEVDHLSVFIVNNMTEPYGWGELGKESLIGIPDFFHYKSVEDVPMERMRIGESHGTGDDDMLLTGSQIESEHGQMFADSLVMSDKAKKFAMAREIERTRQIPYMTHAVFSFSFILLLYNSARIVNKRAGLMTKPPIMRGFMYLSLLPTFILTYCLSKDAYNRQVDREVDRLTASIGPDYSAGGTEYYSKMMNRNVALREFQGESGKSKFNRHGDVIQVGSNDKYFQQILCCVLFQGIIRVKSPSLTERKDICLKQNFIKAS